MRRANWIAEIEGMRRRRTRPSSPVGLGAALDPIQKQLRRAARAVGGLGDAWESILPPELAAASTPERLAGGTLTIRTADAASRFALDRWLRGGGEVLVRGACAGSVRRIRLV